MTEIQVTKRDGQKVPLDIDKFHKVCMWACEGITGVSASEIELRSHIQFYNNIKTKDIQQTLIRAAADLISEETPNYQDVAGRLVNYDIRKNVYGDFTPTVFSEHVAAVQKKTKYYDTELFRSYTEDDWKFFDSQIDHERDFEFKYIGIQQWRSKYVLQNRVTKQIYESPQVTYMLIAMTLFMREPLDQRRQLVVDYYNLISSYTISLPTPIMSAVRTKEKQFSSCVLVDCGDSIDSICATSSAIIKYVSKKAGIGINVGRIRGLGSAIRGGDAFHTGLFPYIKLMSAAVGSCSQGGVRDGSATLYYPIWHIELERLLVLKSNDGNDENTERALDYGVQFSKLFYERLIEDGSITLFSPKDVPGLYEAFISDEAEFKRLYEAAEKNPRIRKVKMDALDVFSKFMHERKGTGRVYLMNMDNVNQQGPFYSDVAPISMSNLCTEINLPTTPLEYLDDPNGEISLCTLSASNWGMIRSPEDFELPCKMAVRALDNLLDYQDYPIEAARKSGQERRPLGVGIINLAYFLARNDLRYSDDSALPMVHEYAEAWSYYLIKASADLAQERGSCNLNHQSKYSAGILPIDTYKKAVDEIVPNELCMDWKALKTQLRVHGIRNSTLMACMPSETSAQISNSTNGIEPPRALVSLKQSKDGNFKQVVPEYKRLKNKYELSFSQESPIGYLNIMAVLQKFMDQGISVNTSYNPTHYEDDTIPLEMLLSHVLHFYRMGGKQLYYDNTDDGSGDEDANIACPSCDL